MNFEEQFPSIELNEQAVNAIKYIPEANYIFQLFKRDCLDKQRVKETFEKFCQINAKYYDVDDEARDFFLKELGLED